MPSTAIVESMIAKIPAPDLFWSEKRVSEKIMRKQKLGQLF